MAIFKLIADMTVTVTVEVEVEAATLQEAINYTEENLCIASIDAEDMNNPSNVNLRFTKNPSAWSTDNVTAHEKVERPILPLSL